MRQKKTVFVVDDDRSMLTSIQRLLRSHDIPVELFPSSTALLTHEHLSRAACLILDIELDQASGIELHRQLSDNGFSPPVIFITGNDTELYRSAALERGCLAYLTKPFPGEALIELKS